MELWLVLAALTAAVMAALASPLVWTAAAPADDVEAQRAVYRDQLNEVARDAKRGLIGADEAKAASNEVARRLIATESATQAVERRTPRLAYLALAMVPAIAFSTYLYLGQPRLPGVPLQARLDRALETQDFAALVAKVERQLAKNPNDAEGWRIVIPPYRQMGRFADAANAIQQLMRIGKPTPELLADYGEMLTMANNGMVTANAAQAFVTALSGDPTLPKARFFAGLALKQEGRREEALAHWRALLADSPPDAPWVELVKAQIGEAAGQNEMILSMVNGLEERLKTENQDLDGWLKLIRSRVVLGETARAKGSYESARGIFKDKPEALAKLAGLAKELRIE